VIAMASLDGGRIGIASNRSFGASVPGRSRGLCQGARPVWEADCPVPAIRWMIADMATEIEAARLLTFNAAAMRDRGENFSAAASMAKVSPQKWPIKLRTELADHGGYGYIKDFAVERYYRDARVLTLYEGPPRSREPSSPITCWGSKRTKKGLSDKATEAQGIQVFFCFVPLPLCA